MTEQAAEIEIEYEDPIWKSISIDDKNKKELYRILRNIEKFHDQRFRVNIALNHILKVYEKVPNKEKYYNLI